VTETGHEVLTCFPAERLMVAGNTIFHHHRAARNHGASTILKPSR